MAEATIPKGPHYDHGNSVSHLRQCCLDALQGRRVSPLNKRGAVAIFGLIAVLPVAALARYVVAPPVADVPSFGPVLLAIVCSVAAARRGSRWWLLVTIPGALWGSVALLQLAIRE